MSLFRERPDLLSRFREGDSEVLEIVFSTYRDDLVRFLVGRYRLSRFDMMDVLSESFCLAFSPRQRTAFNPSVKYFTYLAAIARNVTRTRLRLDARTHPGEVPEEVSHGPERRMEAAELVEKVLETMTQQERNAVIMTLQEHHTQESTARHLGRDRSWVKRTLRRARSRLLQLTVQDNGTEGEE